MIGRMLYLILGLVIAGTAAPEWRGMGHDERDRGQGRSAHRPQQSGLVSAALHVLRVLLPAGKMT